MGFAARLGHVWPLSLTMESLQAPGLRCCSVVQRQPGVADTMIEAR